MMYLRSATAEDVHVLFKWRNDKLTRSGSHNTEEIAFESHVSWLSATLANPMRTLLIAEEDGRPIGTVRVDREPDGTAELSWTVAPTARGRGVAKQMVQLAAEEFSKNCTIRAEVKVGNDASIRVAEAAGMRLSHQDGDVLHFYRQSSDKISHPDRA